MCTNIEVKITDGKEYEVFLQFIDILDQIIKKLKY